MDIKENSFRAYRHNGFIDWLDAIIPARKFKDLYYNDSMCARDFYKDIAQVVQAFFAAGWEGDGEIGIIWIPPFFADDGDTWGDFIWHVKQSNNGISFLASEKILSFKTLEQIDYKNKKENCYGNTTR